MSHSIAELKHFKNRGIYYLDTYHHVRFEVLALTLKWLNIFIHLSESYLHHLCLICVTLLPFKV